MRDRGEAARLVEIARGDTGRRAGGLNAHWCLAGDGNGPEAIAADAVHMGIGYGNRGGGGDHGFDGVAAIAQNGERRLGGERMRGNGHAAGRLEGVTHRQILEVAKGENAGPRG